MKHRRRALGIVALAVVVGLPLLGTSGVASAKVKPGCHKTHTCKSGGGKGSSGGTGGTDPAITVTASPNPLVETGESVVYDVIQVETSPSFADDKVTISSSQLEASCEGLIGFVTLQGQGVPVAGLTETFNNITVFLDDDGNASVFVIGNDCAPGPSTIDASLTTAPYYSALTTLQVNPPVVTTPGVFGYPNPEVETGNSPDSGNSDVYAVFNVETDPVYAEQPVQITANELESSCGQGWVGISGSNGGFFVSIGTGLPISSTLDDDGNAVFAFIGASCAAGTWDVIADVEAGTNPTYTSTFTVDPPQPTI